MFPSIIEIDSLNVFLLIIGVVIIYHTYCYLKGVWRLKKIILDFRIYYIFQVYSIFLIKINLNYDDFFVWVDN